METLLDKYRIITKLGTQVKRKFGDVYLIEDKQSGGKAVLKVLRKTPENLHVQERIKKEASFSFNQSGLQKTLELSETANELLLIKDFIPGVPLDEYWKSIPTKKKQDELLLILNELMPLFTYLKNNNIVHCDIKPGNIIVDKNHQKTSVGLIDFGMAMRTDQRENRKILFPLGYAAPELLLNKLDIIDHRTDLYALGIVIWRLFTGKLPLTHPNPSIFTNLQLTHPLPDSPDLPKGYYPLLKKMCFKHQFRTAPNQLSETEIMNGLKTAMNQRSSTLQEIVDDLKKIPIKNKNWFGF
jgi:serine/threonine protein kinase